MSRKTLNEQNHMYRAAICKALYGELDKEDLTCSLKEALAARQPSDVKAWYDRWPKTSDKPIRSSVLAKLGYCFKILKRY